MGEKTKIDWTDSTWNPLRGCSRMSEGCRNCYAERMAARFSGPGQPYENVMRTGMLTTLWNGQVELVEKHLLDPLKWGRVKLGKAFTCGENGLSSITPKRPRRIFVNSMSDLFHENVTDEMRDRIFAVMALCPQHIFQVLTKRPKRMLEYLSSGRTQKVILELIQLQENGGIAERQVLRTLDKMRRDKRLFSFPLPNVWLGVSVENQEAADERIPLLLQTPAAARFVSCEPMLGSVDLLRTPRPGSMHDWLTGEYETVREHRSTPHLDWVIVGGESGHGARPMHPDWARGLRDQCEEAGVPFFFKSWGEYVPVTDDSIGPHVVEFDDQKYLKCGKKAAGSLLDGGEYKKFPEVNQ